MGITPFLEMSGYQIKVRKPDVQNHNIVLKGFKTVYQLEAG